MTVILLILHNIFIAEGKRLGYLWNNQKARDLVRINQSSGLQSFWVLRDHRLERATLDRLLELSRTTKPVTKLQASDHRDLIYALLGHTDNSLGIVPDYRERPEKVFVDVSMALIANKSCDIDNLLSGHQEDGTYMHDMPSWALDPTAIVSHLHRSEFPRSSMLQAKSPQVRFRIDSRLGKRDMIWPRMHIQGASISHVRCATDSLESFRFQRSNVLKTVSYSDWASSSLRLWLQQIESLLFEFKASSTDYLHPGEEILEIFKYHSWSEQDRSATIEDVRMALGVLNPVTKEDIDFFNNLVDPEISSNWKDPSTGAWTGAWHHVLGVLIRFGETIDFSKARIVFLENGHVGLTIQEVKPGDKAVFLWGVDHPMILRRTGSKVKELYLRQGTILIPGVMDDAFAGALEEETFELL